MEKIIYLIKGLSTESHSQFKNRIFTKVNELILDECPVSVKIVITETLPPKLSIIPFKKKKVASVSVYRETNKLSETLSGMEGFSGAYRVTEALPVAYNKYWEDGEATPGVCLLTLFKQKKGITYEKFIDRWHNSHTPLSLRLHPLWNYSRNVVDEKLTKDSSIWDGIVEEHFRHRSDLLNPFKFFGNLFTIIPNMLKVYTDTNSFLEYKTIETYLAMEYHLITKPNKVNKINKD
jgi:hypothetical protein